VSPADPGSIIRAEVVHLAAKELILIEEWRRLAEMTVRVTVDGKDG